jgi:hypothetical protein
MTFMHHHGPDYADTAWVYPRFVDHLRALSMSNEDPSCDEDIDQDYDTDQHPHLILPVHPDLPDDALMLVHDLLESLICQLYDIYGTQIRRAWRARRLENEVQFNEKIHYPDPQTAHSNDDPF